MPTKQEIYQFLAKNKELQIYLIGDLDDFFWPRTIWYAEKVDGEIKSLALLYTGMEPQTLLAFCETEITETKKLLKSIMPKLPAQFNAHLSSGLLDVFRKENVIKDYGHNYKMALKKNPEIIHDDHIRQLNLDDINSINELYSVSYPLNWFDKRMLETGKYFGYFDNKKLVGISGIHVYSKQYKAAALGNITTHPDYRRRQIAYKLTSVLCYNLKKTIDIIGLNVKSDNIAAIKCYQKIGFVVIGSYDECYLKNCCHAEI